MRVYRWLWIGRIRSASPAIPPGSLIFAAHYNGLVDGFVYGSQSPGALGVISIQWHRHLVGRLLFPGIAVQRAKDAGKAGGDNLNAFRQMVAALGAGERLLFFPEGTSRLGTARLPVARGTLLLLKSAQRLTPPPPVFFVAAHYHDPTRWKSAVTLGWIGPVAPPSVAAEHERWVNENLLAAQALAYAAPPPRRFGLTIVAGFFALPYLPLWALVGVAARRIADEDNVISLWKFLLGVPATLLLLVVYTVVAMCSGFPWWAPAASLAGGWLLWNR
jgi:hypothetical protein